MDPQFVHEHHRKTKDRIGLRCQTKGREYPRCQTKGKDDPRCQVNNQLQTHKLDRPKLASDYLGMMVVNNRMQTKAEILVR